MKSGLAIATGLLGLTIMSVPAMAGNITQCTSTITTIPVSLTTKGVHCLKSNLQTGKATGFAIRINRDDITVDLGGFRILGTAGSNTTTSGIIATNKKNVTVRNGTIEGFYRGVYLDESGGDNTGLLVEHIHAVRNTFTGIQAEGEGIVIRKNRVEETGPGDQSAVAYAIFLNSCKDALVAKNFISNVTESNTSTGVRAQNCPETVIKNNVILNTNTASQKFGIQVLNSGAFLLDSNRIVNGTAGTTGLRVTTGADASCVNNMVKNYGALDSVCNDLVGNQLFN